MNKTIKKYKILCVLGFIIILFLIMTLEIIWQAGSRTLVFETTSKDNTYVVRVNEIATTWPIGKSHVELELLKKKGEAWEGNTYYEFDVNKTRINKKNFDIEWLNDGILLNIKDIKQSNKQYRILWADVFID